MSKSKLTILFIFFTTALVVSGCKKKGVADVNVSINTNVSVSDNEKGDVEIIEDDEDIEVITSDIDTSNWQTYRSEEFGFEFRYPHNLKTIVYQEGEPLRDPINNEISIELHDYDDNIKFMISVSEKDSRFAGKGQVLINEKKIPFYKGDISHAALYYNDRYSISIGALNPFEKNIFYSILLSMNIFK
jgi:hypothetical protein